jgi:acetolactate synthase-1/2/3 large subunit
VGGNVLGYYDLARLLGPEQPFYGLQSRGLSGTEQPLTSIVEIAAAHLGEIREAQPKGPYHLVGVCMGAVVAYEMAQQLRAAGEQVGLLTLLEPRPPGKPRHKPRLWPGPRALTALHFIAARLHLYVQEFARLRGRQRIDYLRGRLKMLTQMVARRDPFRGDRDEFDFAVVKQANLAAVHQYEPCMYPGRVVLLLAEGRKFASEEDDRLAWGRLAVGGIEMYKVPGNDSGLTLMKPNVEVLAERLKGCLERAQMEAPARARPHGAARESERSYHTALQRPPADNVSDAFIELLNAHGVDYIFINPGSDIAPIQESIAKFKAQRRRAPALILCLHESVAMAAAHGYFMVTGRPQVVLVHADVGTQNIGANLHNAQRGRAGVVVCAGTSPRSVGGDRPGGRSRHLDWIQDQFSEARIVAGYVKWHYELTCRENLHVAVQRAFQLAGTEPAGPVYLTLPRDVLMEQMEGLNPEPRRAPAHSTPAADAESITQAAQWLIDAERPLILVAYAGRNPGAVAPLVSLAEQVAAPVVELRHRMNFPLSHPLHLGFSAARQLERADCVLIVDHDVPWVPAQGRPAAGCRIIHVDIDSLKRDIPIWGFPVDLSIQADSCGAMAALAGEVKRRLSPAHRTRIEARRRVLSAEHQAQRAGWRQRALDLTARQPIAPEWAARCLSEIVDENTVIVSEAVSNNPVLWRYLNLDMPGTYYQSLGSGLGWGLGAALGAKLANPSKTIICTVGDGSWVFGSPIVAYSAAERYRSPFLTVIFNNQAYAATTEAILGVAPDGYARKSGEYPGCDLPRPPLYSKVAEAMGLWARTVDDPSELQSVLREALEEVSRGRSALVDICVSSPRPLGRMSED